MAPEDPIRQQLDVDSSRLDGSTLLVRATGTLDVATAPDLGSTLRDLARDEHAHLVLDLSDVGFVDSAGPAVLLNALRRFTRRQRRMLLVAPDESPLTSLLGATGLEPSFEIHDSVKAARKALKAGPLVPRPAGA